MKTVLVVSSTTNITNTISSYVEENKMPLYRYIYLIEFFAEELPHEDKDSLYYIKDFSNHLELNKCIDKIIQKENIDFVISVDEFAVFIASIIRDKLNIDGLSSNEARKFRDKLYMKKILSENSEVNTPKVYCLEELYLNKDINFPLIIKPRSLAGSVGIEVIHNKNELYEFLNENSNRFKSDNYLDMSEDQLECEEFIKGDIYHIDGIVLNYEIIFYSISKYTGTPLEYLKEKPLGSILISKMEENKNWLKFSTEIIKSLRVPNGAFHLEAFLTPSNNPLFLEIGIRPGGGPVKYLIKEVCDVDLLLNHLNLQLNNPVKLEDKRDENASGGWWIYPKIHMGNKNLFVKEILFPNHEFDSNLVFHQLPKVGSKAAEAFFCHEDNLGTFIFKGSSKAIVKDLKWLDLNYKVITI